MAENLDQRIEMGTVIAANNSNERIEQETKSKMNNYDLQFEKGAEITVENYSNQRIGMVSEPMISTTDRRIDARSETDERIELASRIEANEAEKRVEKETIPGTRFETGQEIYNAKRWQ